VRAVTAVFALALSACAVPTQAPLPQQQQQQDARTITGTNWQVTRVNGREVPSPADYSVRFEDGGRLAAKFGCNSMGGRYLVSGSTLQVSDLMQTLMGCPEPSATFESQGSAILRSSMQMSRSASDRVPYEYLSLKNEAGEIILMRRL
jgi:heat shock protein HslJ